MADAEMPFKASVLDQLADTCLNIGEASNTTTSSHLMTTCDESLHSLFLAFPTTKISVFILSPSSGPILNANLFFVSFSTIQGQIN